MKSISIILCATLLAFHSSTFAQSNPKTFVSTSEKTIEVPHNVKGYKVILLENALGKKQLALSAGNFFTRLDNIFSETTTLSKFDFLNIDNTEYLVFEGSDMEWEVSYYWDFTHKKLQFIARNTISFDITKSPELRTNTKLYNEIYNIYLNGLEIEENNNPPKPEFVKELPKPVETTNTTEQPIVQKQTDGAIITFLDLKNNTNKYNKALLYTLNDSKKRIEFLKGSQTYKLDNVFSSTTSIHDCEYMVAEGMEILYFKADDGQWTADYYWNLGNNSLNYIAKNSRTGAVAKSDDLKSNTAYAVMVDNHYSKTNKVASTISNPGYSSNAASSNNTTTNNTQNRPQTTVIPSNAIGLKLGDHLNRIRIFTLTAENSTPKQIDIQDAKLVLFISGNGISREHELFTIEDFSLDPFGYRTIEDNFITENVAGGGRYVLYRNNQDNVQFLPKLDNGNYSLQAVMYANGQVFKSNKISIKLPLQ